MKELEKELELEQEPAIEEIERSDLRMMKFLKEEGVEEVEFTREGIQKAFAVHMKKIGRKRAERVERRLFAYSEFGAQSAEAA